MLAALHNLASGIRLKTPPGQALWQPSHFLPAEKSRHRHTAAEAVKRLKAALSKQT